VVKPGRRVAFGAADVRAADGAILATASGTCLVMA
jgi:acyl-coenzyme A thioesterase PaaI-like protein